MARPPRKPEVPSASAPSASTGKNLGRNVFNNGNAAAVRKSSEALLNLLTDPNRTQEAVEMIQTFAREADPSKPGYEGNEIVASMASALRQLQADRRAALLDAAGRPEIFNKIDEGADPLPDPVDSESTGSSSDQPDNLRNLLGTLFPEQDPLASVDPRELRAELQRYGAPVEGMANEELPAAVREWREAIAAFGNPTTYGGGELWEKARQYDDRAAIDRSVPVDENGVPTVFDKAGKPVRPMTEDEVAAYEKKLVSQIVGGEMMGQIGAIENKGLAPKLPPVRGVEYDDAVLTKGVGVNNRGEIGVQGPYNNKQGQTVDEQLQASVVSPATKGIDELYKARGMMSAEQGGANAGGVTLPNLDYIYGPWRGRFPRRSGSGGIEYPDFAPSGEFIARQFASAKKMTQEATEDFVREMTPVFDAMISEQAKTAPLDRAMQFENQPYIPATGRDAAWTKFQAMPQSEILQGRMFNENMPLNRGAIDLSGLLNDEPSIAPPPAAKMPGGDPLDQPIQGGDLGAPGVDPLDRPVEGNMDDLGYMMPPMNNKPQAYNALAALLA